MPVPWELFERQASRYEAWYAGSRGRRVDQAERELLEWLLGCFPDARSALEVGCGTGHFARWLAGRSMLVVGLDRAPAMLGEMQKNFPRISAVLGDAHHLPFLNGAVDLAVFVTTLEFLDDHAKALAEAVRVARQGLVLVVLNRWSVGGFSRRWGPQACQPLVGQARDYSVWTLRAAVEKVAGERMERIRWASTLFPACLWRFRGPAPLGDVIGMAVALWPLGHCACE